MNSQKIKIGSKKVFGIVFFVVFLIIIYIRLSIIIIRKFGL